jgi:hypothetical protein
MTTTNKQTNSSRAASAFTARFMALSAHGGSRKELRKHVYKEIDEAIEAPGGRKMLRSLVDNYLRGLVPHFAADAAMVFMLYPSAQPKSQTATPPMSESAQASAHTKSASDQETDLTTAAQPVLPRL